MPTANTKLITAVEDYLTDLRRLRASGGATGERSYYPALSALLNAVGATLKPKTFCVAELAAQGAGHPDFGLYTAKQVQRGHPKEGQVPERGVVEVKSASDNAWLTAGWGHYGTGDAVMPGQGRVVERDYTADERTVLGDAIGVLGQTTFDIYLNGNAYWSNVPAKVWRYKLGGYQVLKKWLSYRECSILGRALFPDEVQYLTDTTRRIGAMLLPRTLS